MAGAQANAVLFATATCRPVAELKQAVAQVNVVSSEIRTCRLLVAQAHNRGAAHQAGLLVNAALFKTPIGRPIVAPRLEAGLGNAVLSVTMTCRPCAAHRQAQAQANAALFAIPICRQHAELKLDKNDYLLLEIKK